MTKLLPVTQADRDRVQAFHSAMLDKLMTAVKDKTASGRFGEDEGDAGTLVQAFAAHRIAATPAPDSEKLREALKTATGLASGPNGAGRMKVVIDGLEPGQEHKLHYLLSAALGASA